MRRLAMLLVLAAGCSKHETPPASSRTVEAMPTGAAVGEPPGPTCPSTGLWQACSVIYHLARAGLAPSVDSSAAPADSLLSIKPLILKIGQLAVLEVYLYADSAARKADAARLDRTQFVDGTAPQTIRRERTLIESVNLIGLLTSLNGHQRERVSDALTAGPPQPSTPAAGARRSGR